MNKYTLIAGTLLFSSLPLTTTTLSAQAPAQQQPAEVTTESLYQEMLQTVRFNDPNRMRTAVDKLLQRQDLTAAQRYTAHFEMGSVHQLRNQRPQAITEYEKALAIPGLSLDQEYEVVSKMLQIMPPNQIDNARTLVDKQLARKDLSANQRHTLLFGMGLIYQAANQRPNAIEWYEQTLAIDGITADQQAATASRSLQILNNTQIAKAREITDNLLARKDLSPVQKYTAYSDIGRYYQSVNQRANAIKEYSLAAQVAEVTPTQKYDALLRKAENEFALQFTQTAQATYYDNWVNQAKQTLQEALKVEGLTNTQKIEILKREANAELETMNVQEANQLLEQAIALTDLTPAELAIARLNYAAVLIRQGEPTKAIALYDQILSAEGQNPNQKIDTHIIRSSLEKDVAARVAYLRKNDIPLLRIADIIRHQDGDLYVSLIQEALKDETINPDQRWNSYRFMIAHLASVRKFDELKAEFQKHADTFHALNSARNTYRSLFTDGRVNDAINRVPAFKLWIGETLLQKEIDENDRKIALRYVVEGASEVLGQQNKVKPALDRLIALDTNLKAEDRINLQMRLAIIQANNNADNAVKAILALLAKEKLEPKAKAEALLTAAKYAMKTKQFEAARKLYYERKNMLVQNETPTLKLTFIPDGPKDITAFLQSDYFKNAANRGVLNRQYGGDLQLLIETDTASAGRTMTTADGKTVSLTTGDGAQATSVQSKAQETFSQFTTFTASCDEDGVYLFFFMPADAERLKGIREGTAGMGGFEITFSEGRDMPYSCFLIEPYPSKDLSDGFLTQYNNRNYRIKQVAHKNLKMDLQIVETGVAMLLSMTWDAFVQLPQNGDKWYLEPIHWERGNWTWGGSNSVHWRETQGELIFDNLTAENRTAIQRRLLQRAKSQYLREKSPRSNGYIEIWQDNRLGDQDFYAEVVKPLEEKYDAYANRITNTMSDQEVNEVFDNAYDFFINARFILSELRAQYLLKRQTAGM